MIVKKNINKVFLVFLSLHLIVWTLVPALSNVNLPLDTIEHLAWASNLDWGFNKHPPLVAFVLDFFFQIFGNQDWAYYFLSQIFVISAFFIVWIFSKEFFQNQIYSLISIFLLEGIFFYNFTSPEFNVNVCQLPFWALSVLYAWKGLKDDKILDWLLLGLFAGLGFLTKYLFIYLLVAIGLFLTYMISKKKISLKSFVSLVPFFLILFPHLIWLTENEYITITYGLNRAGTEDQSFLNHFLLPIVFFTKQIGILLPFFVMCLFLLSKFRTKLNFKDQRLLFLISISLLPIILIFLTSLMMGVKIRTMWMTPFYLFFGVLFVYLFQKKINLKKINKFFILFLFLFIFSPVTYLFISISKTDKRTDYPGREIARLVQNKWDNNFRNEIKIVVGDEWFAGNLSYHLRSRPQWNLTLENSIIDLSSNKGVIYIGNPQVLKKVCPGVFGVIRPAGYCMIGQK